MNFAKQICRVKVISWLFWRLASLDNYQLLDQVREFEHGVMGTCRVNVQLITVASLKKQQNLNSYFSFSNIFSNLSFYFASI